MAHIARRTAFAARRAPVWAVRRTYAAKAQDFSGDEPEEKKVNLKEGAKRDPELFVCLSLLLPHQQLYSRAWTSNHYNYGRSSSPS